MIERKEFDRGKQHCHHVLIGTASDQSSFRRGVGVVACKRCPVIGYYTPNIHTRHDIFADEKNIEYLVESLGTFVKTIAEN